MRPMLASPGTAIPNGQQWTHEIKWDGMRVLADVTDGRFRLGVGGADRGVEHQVERLVGGAHSDDLVNECSRTAVRLVGLDVTVDEEHCVPAG